MDEDYQIDESETTSKGFLNTSLDRSSILKDREIVNAVTEKSMHNVKISPLVVTSHSHSPDGESGQHSASATGKRRERGEDRVEIMVKEGKVAFSNIMI